MLIWLDSKKTQHNLGKGCNNPYKRIHELTKMLTNPLRPYAIGSGQRVAIVFGVISPKIRRSTVAVNVAIVTPFCPKSESAIEVRIAERKIFTRSFEMRIVFIRCSFLSRSLPARKARLFLFLRRILRRSLFIPKNALSEIENNMESTIRENAIINKYEGMSSKL